MTSLSKIDLLDRVVSAVASSGAQSFIQTPSHPFVVSVWTEEVSRTLRIYVWNVTPGGPPSVRSSTEYRIQLTGVGSSLRFSPGIDTLLLGWSEEFRVFTAFEASRHSTFGSSPSIQVNQATLEKAQQSGIGFQMRGNQEAVICFAPDQFSNYVFNLSLLHGVAIGLEDHSVLEHITDDENEIDQQELEAIPETRREVLEQVHRWVRQRSFRSRVLSAYGHRCSVCNIQLQLVQAAHIVPVKVPGSSDLTSNGVSLCPSHHVAYDSGLLGIAPNYHVIVNQERLGLLRNSGLHGGEEALINLVCSTINVPNRTMDRPGPENLALGLRIRGWTQGSYGELVLGE